MIYLESFTFPDADKEFDFFLTIKRTCYDSLYPFRVLSQRNFSPLEFEPITLLYGGNGSGKSTALNVIAEKLALPRDSKFNQSNFFDTYVELCQRRLADEIPEGSRIITSDDVFDYMLNIRTLNEGIDQKRETLFDEYLDSKYAEFKFTSLKDYEQLKKVNLSRSKTQSKFIRKSLIDTIRERSNGENAYAYFSEKIGENGLFLLDEPENSLSPERQLQLVQFIEDSVRFFGCQFIISTHSPFLLAMKGAKIYDLDENPVIPKKWTELKNVRVFYDFFTRNKEDFD